MTENPADRRTSQLLGAHAVLALGWGAWRIVESTPALASAWGGAFAASVPGRASALITLLLGVIALFAVLVRTAQTWRDPRSSGLLVALLAAIPGRGRVDVFDLVYVALTALVATAWFDGRWRLRRASDRSAP